MRQPRQGSKERDSVFRVGLVSWSSARAVTDRDRAQDSAGVDSAGPMARLDTLARVVYRLLADLAVVVHFAFIAFVAVGAFMAWRWPWLVWLHVPSVIYSALIITVGFQCFLTPLEVDFRERAGEEGYSGGFVDRYIEDVVYPGEYTTALRALVAVAIVVEYVGLYLRRRRDREARSS